MPDIFDPTASQMSVVSARQRLADYITDLLARTTLELWLYQTNIAPSPTNTLANFTEATFSNYSRFSVTTFTAGAVDPQSNAYSTSAMANYICSGAGVQNTIYGSILVASVTGGVAATATATGAASGAYATAITITNRGTLYTAPPKVTLNGASGSGAAAHAVLNADGTLFEIIVDSAGSGYTTYTVLIDGPRELIKQNVLSANGISMALSTDALTTYTQLIEPANAQ